MSFRVILENRAAKELQDAIYYYDNQQVDLEKKFANDIDIAISHFARNPFYQIRYSSIRCLPLKKFPFMLHFYVDEQSKTIKIFAILHVARNPNEHYPES
jgi:toxin ParE1/3/4